MHAGAGWAASARISCCTAARCGWPPEAVPASYSSTFFLCLSTPALLTLLSPTPPANHAAGMHAVDGAFCRWAAMARQQPGALLSALLRPAGAAATSAGAAPGAEGLPECWPGSSAALNGASSEQPGAGVEGIVLPPLQRGRFVLDYINDEQLAPLRMRFAAVRLRPAEGLQELVRCGAAYAERLHAHGVWAAWLRGGGGGIAPRQAAAA